MHAHQHFEKSTNLDVEINFIWVGPNQIPEHYKREIINLSESQKNYTINLWCFFDTAHSSVLDLVDQCPNNNIALCDIHALASNPANKIIFETISNLVKYQLWASISDILRLVILDRDCPQGVKIYSEADNSHENIHVDPSTPFQFSTSTNDAVFTQAFLVNTTMLAGRCCIAQCTDRLRSMLGEVTIQSTLDKMLPLFPQCDDESLETSIILTTGSLVGKIIKGYLLEKSPDFPYSTKDNTCGIQIKWGGSWRLHKRNADNTQNCTHLLNLAMSFAHAVDEHLRESTMPLHQFRLFGHTSWGPVNDHSSIGNLTPAASRVDSDGSSRNSKRY